MIEQKETIMNIAYCTLDWEPSIPLEEGLKRTIMYFKKQLNV